VVSIAIGLKPILPAWAIGKGLEIGGHFATPAAIQSKWPVFYFRPGLVMGLSLQYAGNREPARARRRLAKRAIGRIIVARRGRNLARLRKRSSLSDPTARRKIMRRPLLAISMPPAENRRREKRSRRKDIVFHHPRPFGQGGGEKFGCLTSTKRLAFRQSPHLKG